ncbi:hypothetical protein [Paludisphaera rhizosphaerae]|uniref:hypothetical protein n=1 Tax=Paludisphaera rhizosphaerae TaxID=2711216 RepID=UPI00197DC57C|nr:hypothetical protein [Paludisphaera rhizosphaerae]
MSDDQSVGADSVSWIKWVLANANERKSRLFACACVRRFLYLARESEEPEAFAAIDTAERFADGDADASELQPAADAAYEAATRNDGPEMGNPLLDAVGAAAEDLHTYFTKNLLEQAEDYSDCTIGDPTYDKWVLSWHRHVLRAAHDVFGERDHPTPFDPAWRTSEVENLARRIYEERDFGRMPELGAALRAAGCDDAEVLAHCESPEGHSRGCWVIDAILGRS